MSLNPPPAQNAASADGLNPASGANAAAAGNAIAIAAGNAAAAAPRNLFLVLARYRAVQLRNSLDQLLRQAPMRAFTVLALLLVIWLGLYWILMLVLSQLTRWELSIAQVANQQIFVYFFLVLAIMLGFSSAILAYGSLFSRLEAGCLLALPIPPRQAITVKWLEGMLLSSWSFLLLGVPLMLAMTRTAPHIAWYYYPLFVGHFLAFIVLPSTFGVLVAWAVAMWAPRRPLTLLLTVGGVLLALGTVWLWFLLRGAEHSDWLETFYARLSLAKQPFFPSTWSAKGVVAAMQDRASDSLFYLATVLANSVFFAWLTINIVGHWWAEAYNRAHKGRARSHIRSGWITALLTRVFFFYLPPRLRAIMQKDLRSFVRDAPQWAQIVIMLGLLMLYAVKLQSLNMSFLPVDFAGPGLKLVLAFLNLVVVSLILATFTSRFVFPLLSLESQQLWLLGLLPVRRVSILLVKFLFSLTIMGVSSLVVMGLAVRALELPPAWARLELVVAFAVCIGLSGLAVGLGARFPVLNNRNPARIASGFGGTFNLIASMLFVAVEMGILAALVLKDVTGSSPDISAVAVPLWLEPTLVAFAVIVAAVSLGIGVRHFERIEV